MEAQRKVQQEISLPFTINILLYKRALDVDDKSIST